MTINAIAIVTGAGTDVVAGNFNIIYNYAVTDGTSDLAGGSFAQVPFTLNDKKSDNAIRDAIAAKILSDHNLVIDPDDIYFPHP